jgi:hypothetical protein
MKSVFESHWLNELNRKNSRKGAGGNKLRSYCTFKNTFQYEPYLDLLPNFHARKRVTRLRISAHSLEIERGRHTANGKRKPENERLCTHCNLNDIEDERHVLLACPSYAKGRSKMLDELGEIFPMFHQVGDEHKYIFIMQCTDSEVAQILASMLEHVNEKRGNL